MLALSSSQHAAAIAPKLGSLPTVITHAILSYLPYTYHTSRYLANLLVNKSLAHDVELFRNTPFYKHLMIHRVKKFSSKPDPIAYRDDEDKQSRWIFQHTDLNQCEQKPVMAMYAIAYVLTLGCCCHCFMPCDNYARRRRHQSGYQ
ncbi:hypothetical protein TrLO_g9285 [Triparma laevis f. longispina]|uniref:Uncharacterized protein n=1 Tax=Triparma laevis f. longispina TaxID=1714387 RepID=A0A9W7FR43_9STRA|nr:hypothetical protein TrLO_g9285 [Triparma laevis f. longispina]